MYGLIAHSKFMVSQLHENGNVTAQTLLRMKIGWAAYRDAYQRNWRTRHPPPPPPLSHRQP